MNRENIVDAEVRAQACTWIVRSTSKSLEAFCVNYMRGEC